MAAARPAPWSRRWRRSAFWRGRAAAARPCPTPSCGLIRPAEPCRCGPRAWRWGSMPLAASNRCPWMRAGGAAATSAAGARPGAWSCLAGAMAPSTAAARPCFPSRWSFGCWRRPGRRDCRCATCCCWRSPIRSGGSAWWRWCGPSVPPCRSLGPLMVMAPQLAPPITPMPP